MAGPGKCFLVTGPPVSHPSSFSIPTPTPLSQFHCHRSLLIWFGVDRWCRVWERALSSSESSSPSKPPIPISSLKASTLVTTHPLLLLLLLPSMNSYTDYQNHNGFGWLILFAGEVRRSGERVGFEVVTLDGRTCPLASTNISRYPFFRFCYFPFKDPKFLFLHKEFGPMFGPFFVWWFVFVGDGAWGYSFFKHKRLKGCILCVMINVTWHWCHWSDCSVLVRILLVWLKGVV